MVGMVQGGVIAQINEFYDFVKLLSDKDATLALLQQFRDATADQDAKTAAALDPSDKGLVAAVSRLEKASAEKLEKQKEEMLGKLKDLGNSVLGKFGLSLDNFKAVKDPNTGSYSISFGQ